MEMAVTIGMLPSTCCHQRYCQPDSVCSPSTIQIGANRSFPLRCITPWWYVSHWYPGGVAGSLCQCHLSWHIHSFPPSSATIEHPGWTKQAHEALSPWPMPQLRTHGHWNDTLLWARNILAPEGSRLLPQAGHRGSQVFLLLQQRLTVTVQREKCGCSDGNYGHTNTPFDSFT